MPPFSRAGGGLPLLLAMILAGCSPGKPPTDTPNPVSPGAADARSAAAARARNLGLSLLRRHAPPGSTFEIRSAALLQSESAAGRHETFHFVYAERRADGQVRTGEAIVRSEDDGRRFISFWRREDPPVE